MGGEKLCTGWYEEIYLLLIELTDDVAPPSKACAII